MPKRKWNRRGIKKIIADEFSYSSFERSFSLPEELSGEGMEAKYENAILKLTMPKKESPTKAPAKQIKVN